MRWQSRLLATSSRAPAPRTPRPRLTVDVMRRAIFVHPALPEVVQAAIAELPADVGARHGATLPARPLL